ncbi:MAG: hypothetical protein GX439_03975 [Bacteroidales bacterium]|nr:hypothetical protein [Bacteroidales bacterium]
MAELVLLLADSPNFKNGFKERHRPASRKTSAGGVKKNLLFEALSGARRKFRFFSCQA